MTISVDLGRLRITASVGDLTGQGQGRVIGLGGSGLTRMWIGQELHRQQQDRRLREEPGYAAEVPVGIELEVDGWTVAISGRADGVLYDGETPVRVDEIKTLHFAVDLTGLYTQERLEPFEEQVRLYGWMLSSQGPPIQARLVLVDIVSGEERIKDVGWTPETVEAWIRKTVHRLVSREQRRLEQLERRLAVAEAIPFPHPELRPHQAEIGEAVEAAIDRGGHLLLQAPTGTGKTAAVLHPAVKAAFRHGKRVFFLTAKTLQQHLAVETLRAMQGRGTFRSQQLRAKRKMCCNSEMVCHEAFCPWAAEYGLKMIRTGLVRSLMDDRTHQDPDEIYDRAFNHEVCPFEVSLDLMPEMDVVVCDYNYVFDPGIGLEALLDGQALSDAVLVIDECHNLVDRSREYYSPVLGQTETLVAAEFLERQAHPVFDRLAGLCRELAGIIGELVEAVLPAGAAGDVLTEFDDEAFPAIRMAFDAAMLEYFLYKREHDLWWADDPVMDVFLALTRFHRVLGLGGAEFVHLARRSHSDGPSLKVFCRDASRFTGAVLNGCAGVIAMSATLEPFDFYIDLLGFDRSQTAELSVPSPFPKDHRLIVNIPTVDTTWRNRGRHHDAVAEWIARLAPEDRNALVLFPSYAYLEAVQSRLVLQHHRVVVQRSQSSDETQVEILKGLASNGGTVLLAVLGGIYAEGVDYPGDMLSQVVVVSPGLPQFNTERQLLRDYFEETYGHGFSYAFLIPGMTRVVQAAGRLIRSRDDRGVIVLIGRRFQDGRHARYLPRDWVEDDPTTLLHDDPEFSIRRFFDD